MSINLNESGEQSTEIGTIPPNSKVFVKLSIQYPKAGREGQNYPLTRASQSSLEYLSTKLDVATGTFAGKKIFHNFNLSGASTAGQQKAVDISMRTIRALVEAARGISPNDSSPQGTQARILNAWTDIEGSVFPIVVGCEFSLPNKEGKVFVNNVLKRVVTLDEAEYQQLREKGEIISEDPIPEVTAKTTASGASVVPQPAWAQTSTATPPPAVASPPPASVVPQPSWAQPQSDSVPF